MTRSLHQRLSWLTRLSWTALGLSLALACTPPSPSTSGSGSGGSKAGSGGTNGSGGNGSGGSGSGGRSSGSGGNGSGGSSNGSGGSSNGSGGSSDGSGGSSSGGNGSGGSASGGSGVGGRGTGTGGAGAGGQTGSGGAGLGGSAAGGAGGSVACTFTAMSALSTAIPTVGIVTWSTTLPGITSAEIQFGPADASPTMTAPVDLTQTSYRTLLLGMKGSRAYAYRIVATSPAGSCTSQSYMLTTGAVPTSVPKPTVMIMNAAAHAKGFILTSGGVALGGGGGTILPAVILDADGDVVWWATPPTNASRIHMSWDGKDMWMIELNVDNAGGEMRRVAMDGTNPQNNLAGLVTSHHDFTVLPDGGIATLLWNTTGIDAHNSLIERAADGKITVVIADLSSIYNSTTFHANAIHYYPSDDSYTISDRNVNAFFKVTRKGQLVWQFGGTNPKGQAFMVSGGAWMVNHGHQLLDNGNFLFFNNGAMSGGQSAALEYKLDTTAWTATRVWSYQAAGVTSPVLGDAQRLPNGNTLVTFSTSGTIHEVDPAGKLVMSVKASSVGYADFRPTLYGPPLR